MLEGNRRSRLWIGVVSLLLLVSLTACGLSEQTDTNKEKNEASQKKESEKNSESEEQDYEVASNIEEIIKEKKGKYSGNAYNKAVIHRALDNKSFQDKDSFQIYHSLLQLIREGKNYQPYYTYFEEFNPSIETIISEMPGGMKLDEDGGLEGNTNIAILLDASGSMAQKIGGKTKMDLAKNAINEFVASMPEGANVSLRVYGHKGSNSDSDKKSSCNSTEIVYDLKPYNSSVFTSSLGKFQPTGWTPIAKAIIETKADFEKANLPGKNIIYIVSDGVETCDGNPAKAAKELHDSNIEAVVNIIGFDVDRNGQKQLLAVAEAGGGEFETVDTAEDFKRLWKEERQRLWNEWWDWGNENWNKVWDEQAKKENELHGNKSEFSNLIYDEKSRLTEASYYLQEKEQISYDVRLEVDSLINQRYEILNDYSKETYDELSQTLKAEGKELKESIKEKEKEMKDKYK
ncbi:MULTISPECIES: VWA domain-containing protein [Bacillus]|uniref:VWA domain-containing protein n=1 Tax=Bacillus TaxID=1386 RepID=UPI00031B6F59|nr:MULTISPECIES: VWA domain-containing protein [Bacillus]